MTNLSMFSWNSQSSSPMEQGARLLLEVTRAIAEAEGFESALLGVLTKVCEATAWDYAEAWIPSPDGRVLQAAKVWAAKTPREASFGTLSRGFTFEKGVGLPGRVWASRRSEWIPDASTVSKEDFPRVGLAHQAGLRASVAVPILAGGEVVAVLSFFMAVARPQEQHMVDLVSAVAMEVSLLMQRTVAEDALRRVNRALRTLSGGNQVLVRATDEPSLLHDMCHTIVSLGGYRLAWVGFAEQDQGKSVRPVAQAGYEDGYLDTVNITWADTPRGRGPTGSAIRSGQPSIMRRIPTDPDYEPWRAEAIQRGYASSIALPLVNNGQVLGALNIYSPEPDAFDDQEVKLLVEMAADLSYGITALRTRAQRQQAEEALRASEQQLSRIFDTVADVIYLHTVEQDGHYRFAAVNRAFHTVTGLAQDQVLGKRVDEVIPQPSLTFVLEKYKEAIREKRIVRWEETSEYPMGRLVGEVSVAPVFNDAGVCAHLVGAVHDVTERKRNEEALRESEELLRTVLETTTDAIAITVGARRAFVNKAFMELHGLEDASQAVELPMDQFIVPEHREMVRERTLARQRGEPVPAVYEYRIRRIDGEERTVEASASLIHYKGQPASLGVLRDATERYRTQTRLMQADRLAAIGTMFSGVVHEVNNPLAGALGRADLMLRGGLDEAVRSDLQVVRDEMQRAVRTLQNLLAFAREHKPEKAYISINEVLESVLALRAYQMRVSNLEVVRELQEGLPRTMADAHQMQQAFFNIVLNAEQAMAEAHGRGTLSVATRLAGDAVQVLFADDGPGIPKENLGRVFDPFFTTKPPGKGTGLGLSVCYGIVQGHGGSIRAESEVGKGATFTMELPVVPEPLPMQ